MKRALFGFGVLFSALLAQARVGYVVTVRTVPLIGHPAGPFSVAFQLADGRGTGDGNNAAVLSQFDFGVGGHASGSPKLLGSAQGNLSSTVVLTDGGLRNFFAQPFVPGDTLSFVLALSANVEDGSIPDGFSFSILDRTGAPIPTLVGAPLDVFAAISLDSTNPSVQTFGSNPTRSPSGGGGPIGNITPPVSLRVPVISGLPAVGCRLWPPDQQLVQVATVSATDALFSLASFDVTGSSNEPLNADSPDIVITGSGLQPRVVQLRAARLGDGAGRVYTLTATATDVAGNTTTLNATCTVPHDLGN